MTVPSFSVFKELATSGLMLNPTHLFSVFKELATSGSMLNPTHWVHSLRREMFSVTFNVAVSVVLNFKPFTMIFVSDKKYSHNDENRSVVI